MAGFFCITRISGTSHKIGRNFSQDLPHLVTRYQASRFLASFYVLFCGHIPLPVGNMPLPKNCPKNPSEVSASPQTACSWAFRLKDWLLKFFSRVFILSAGIYVFSAMAVYFPASSEFSPCTCVLFTFRPLGPGVGRISFDGQAEGLMLVEEVSQCLTLAPAFVQ